MFAALGAFVRISPWPLPFTIMGGKGDEDLKITLNRVRLKCKKGRMMRTSLIWIQPHHILNTINSFLYSSTNYLENRLLPNDLIIVRNHGADEEDVRDTNTVLESQRDIHDKVEMQPNSESQSLSSSPTWSPGPPCIQIDAQDAYDLRLQRSPYARKEYEINFPMRLVSYPTKIGVVCNH
jgi:hypothetical protein